MGKSIISQARGHGSLTYQVRKRAYIYKIKYPSVDGEAEILDILHSAAHSAPLAKLKVKDEIFYIPAFNKAVVGQKTLVGGLDAKDGNILLLKNIPAGASIFNIEANPGDGGKLVRAGGMSATVSKIMEN